MPKLTERQKIIANIIKNVHSKKWECVIDGCTNPAINSHLLQQNGILDNVSVDGHLIEYKPTDPFTWKEDSLPFEKKRIGKKNAFSLPLFCNNHDSSIFKEVETHPIDLEQYRVQLLLSYRVICAEIRKKQVNVEQFSRLLNAETLKGDRGRENLRLVKEGNELGIKDLEKYKILFEEELINESSRFTFKIYKYPFLDIYGSAVFSPLDYLKTDAYQSEPLNGVFIHVIPYNDFTNIIVGYCNNYTDDWIVKYIDSWNNLEEEDFEKKLTQLFAAHIENWGMSPDLLKEIKKDNLQRLEEYMAKNANNLSQHQKVNFNLFEYDEE
ncbi:hypothetical protein [Rufibacter quisquiliarum]|uniref:Uncharacterized protein n=1 Tax=Rufibacter quisquiliarum TaxID=1549639 RepID=A0A839GYK1_9BACT|nr:hypothetical protein [Rufibacter quisquiliarum]MBA9079907.1 hypothetical protein [Rufibacter quisquiliarum]